MANYLAVASLLISCATLALAIWAVVIARSSLKQAEQVSERDRRDWRQRKWFDLYFKADEAYNLLDHFQTLYGGAPPAVWTQDQVRDWNNLMFHIRTAHSMAVVFPKNAAADELFECTKFKEPADTLSKERLQKLLDAVEGLRQNALINKSVLG